MTEVFLWRCLLFFVFSVLQGQKTRDKLGPLTTVFNFLPSLVPSPGRCVLLTEPWMETLPFHVTFCVPYRALPSSVPWAVFTCRPAHHPSRLCRYWYQQASSWAENSTRILQNICIAEKWLGCVMKLTGKGLHAFVIQQQHPSSPVNRLVGQEPCLANF